MFKSATSMGDFVYVRDLDNFPCVTAKKKKVTDELGKRIAHNKILIIVGRIESWCLAGVNEQIFRNFNIRKKIENTKITKAGFEQLIPKGMAKIEFMNRILEQYDIRLARKQNRSLRYFLDKWIDFQQKLD